MCLAVSMIPIGIIGGLESLSYSSFLIVLIFSVTFVVSLVISFFITRPIVRLTKNIDEISKGRLDVDLENSEIYEINNLTDSLNRIMASLKLAIHKVGVKKDEIFEDTVKFSEIAEKKHEVIFEKGQFEKNKNIISANSSEEIWTEHEFDSIFILDEKANILDCNENMYKKLGYTKSEMLSLNMADFDALESKKDLSNKINKAKKEGAISFKSIHKRKDGSAILVFENLQYDKDKNKFKCIVREDYSLKKSK